jgi:hypothetical protein
VQTQYPVFHAFVFGGLLDTAREYTGFHFRVRNHSKAIPTASLAAAQPVVAGKQAYHLRVWLAENLPALVKLKI